MTITIQIITWWTVAIRVGKCGVYGIKTQNLQFSSSQKSLQPSAADFPYLSPLTILFYQAIIEITFDTLAHDVNTLLRAICHYNVWTVRPTVSSADQSSNVDQQEPPNRAQVCACTFLATRSSWFGSNTKRTVHDYSLGSANGLPLIKLNYRSSRGQLIIHKINSPSMSGRVSPEKNGLSQTNGRWTWICNLQNFTCLKSTIYRFVFFFHFSYLHQCFGSMNEPSSGSVINSVIQKDGTQ